MKTTLSLLVSAILPALNSCGSREEQDRKAEKTGQAVTEKNAGFPDAFRSRGKLQKLSGTFSAAAESFKNCPGRFPQPRKASKIVRGVFRSRGKFQKSSGTFSAAAESFKNHSGCFPQPRKASKIIRDVFRSRGKLQKSSGTFSAGAESFKNHSGHFPQARISWPVNFQI
jgi:hypothetical protein